MPEFSFRWMITSNTASRATIERFAKDLGVTLGGPPASLHAPVQVLPAPIESQPVEHCSGQDVIQQRFVGMLRGYIRRMRTRFGEVTGLTTFLEDDPPPDYFD